MSKTHVPLVNSNSSGGYTWSVGTDATTNIPVGGGGSGGGGVFRSRNFSEQVVTLSAIYTELHQMAALMHMVLDVLVELKDRQILILPDSIARDLAAFMKGEPHDPADSPD